jgi:hypothetical protein
VTSPLHAHIQTNRDQGFREVKTDSGTGSYVLIHDQLARAVKFNQDPAYDQFVRVAQARPNLCFPRILLHEAPLGAFSPIQNLQYTITEMEVLSPLSQEEQHGVLLWLQRSLGGSQSTPTLDQSTDDPYGLLAALKILKTEADGRGVGWDLVSKGTNVMFRTTQDGKSYVITDPWSSLGSLPMCERPVSQFE